jgi:hypothetical protein
MGKLSIDVLKAFLKENNVAFKAKDKKDTLVAAAMTVLAAQQPMAV